MPIVKMTRVAARKAMRDVDWKKIDAMTDADIERQIAANPDTVSPDDVKHWVMVPQIKGKQITALRRRMKLSQARFAKKFGLRLRTIQEWEQGRRQPEEAARLLLKVIEREPAAVERALAKGT